MEQPRLSKLQDHPHFQYMMRFLLQRGIKLQRHEVHLGEYGAESLKPIWLYAPLEITFPVGRVNTLRTRLQLLHTTRAMAARIGFAYLHAS